MRTAARTGAAVMTGALTGALLITLGMTLQHCTETPPETMISCPQEDSCGTPDYRDGGWYINDRRMTK